MKQPKDTLYYFLGFNYLLGIIVACTFFYSLSTFPQNTRLMIDTSVPLITRMVITSGLFVIPVIMLADIFKKKFLHASISIFLLTMIMNNTLL
ncbi:hypothetical protein K9M47_01880 [Candidatus Gracilibacteria bacterium]|nr:hypothetical protein [Candidatus Gracilibacteria bacterium]